MSSAPNFSGGLASGRKGGRRGHSVVSLTEASTGDRDPDLIRALARARVRRTGHPLKQPPTVPARFLSSAPDLSQVGGGGRLEPCFRLFQGLKYGNFSSTCL